MKKLLIGLLLAVSTLGISTGAVAHGYYRVIPHRIVPFAVGVGVGVLVTRPHYVYVPGPVYYTPAPVYVYPAPVYVQQPNGYYISETSGQAIACTVRSEFYRSTHTQNEVQQCENFWHSIGQ